MPNTTFKLGTWKVVCDRCGFRYHNTDLRKEWTGLMVCHGPGTNDCWEIRHPQEFVRGVRDEQAPPWTRPAPAVIYLDDALETEIGVNLLLELGGIPLSLE
jgi:hypothetical protein